MQLIVISTPMQRMQCYEEDVLYRHFCVSTGKNGVGELSGSECTPRGWHAVHKIIGQDHPTNSVFVARQWTNEIYSAALAKQFPNRDWILTRIIQLEGLEEGRNKGGMVDTLSRYIYIHGTPDTTKLGIPGSHGCIRMNNQEIIELANWIKPGVKIYIE